MAEKPHYEKAVAAFASLGADALARIIVESLTSAGASEEWDSETIELVLVGFEDPIKKLGIPWVGDSGGVGAPNLKYWSKIARELNYAYDFRFEEDEDDDESE